MQVLNFKQRGIKMGYTHYWTFKKQLGQTSKTELRYQKAIKKCNLVIQSYNNDLKKIDSKHPDRLSGFSAHVKKGSYGGLFINGTEDLSHEDFTIREHFSQNFGFQKGFNFCKTAQKPYDIAVVACLIILQHYLKDAIEVSSDGDATDWFPGLKIAIYYSKIKGLKVPENIDRRAPSLKIVG